MKDEVMLEGGDALDRAIDAALARSKELPRFNRQVIAAQRALRRTASPAAWQAYLKIEEAVNAREGERMRVIARRFKLPK